MIKASEAHKRAITNGKAHMEIAKIAVAKLEMINDMILAESEKGNMSVTIPHYVLCVPKNVNGVEIDYQLMMERLTETIEAHGYSIIGGISDDACELEITWNTSDDSIVSDDFEENLLHRIELEKLLAMDRATSDGQSIVFFDEGPKVKVSLREYYSYDRPDYIFKMYIDPIVHEKFLAIKKEEAHGRLHTKST